ncbi:AraC family transcriptional regulator ligand-binding domain-containing protein [Litorivivens lipolytica]|uniref:AraC family transcriptional regulator ligand-binding domain-containing protein n=1 Tax=Litorivivens lipolytica TaxID=1524264 RepID=UPI00160B84BA
MNSRTISISFVRAMLEKFEATGHSRESLLQSVGIAPSALHQNKARIAPAQFSQLARLAMKWSEDEAVGHYPQHVPLGSYRVLAEYVSGGGDLREALKRQIRFDRLINSGFSVKLVCEGRIARYQIHSPEPLRPWVVEQHLMLTHRLMSWLVGTPLPLQAVHCQHPAPTYRDEYHYLFFSPTRFEQPLTELVFEERLLDLPIIKSREELDALIRQLPYNLLFMPTHQKSYTERIRRYIRNSLPKSPSYEQIAHSLGLTPQTLRRRLRDEGCDFRQIRNELLRDTAINLLEQTDNSVQEIAYSLGFSEPSAFIRSFKNWTGIPPNNYRRQHET